MTIPFSIPMFGEPYWSEPKPRKKIPKHWYFIDVDYCSICGGSKVYRERKYTERPENYESRHDFEEVYDYCDAL